MPPSETNGRPSVLKTMSAIVLAGGASKRFGADKTRSDWGGRPLLEHVVSPLTEVFGEVVVVTRRPEGLAGLRGMKVRVVEDRFPEPHPMGGLLTGLEACVWEYAFVCGADMPFVSPGLAKALGEAAAGYGAAVPFWKGRLEPLCAVYARRVCGVLRRLVAEERLALADLMEIVPTRYLLEEEVAAADPKGRSFIDIDTPADRRRHLPKGARNGA
ncbi:molybdenum cofactor guanylyltransferase [bacterium]|nr:MAG: molybdenum cofactor guanylyltransferase [bacterium]